MERLGRPWRVKILGTHVGLLGNGQPWDIRESRKPEPVEWARARGDSEPIMVDKEKPARELARQAMKARWVITLVGLEALYWVSNTVT